MIDTRITFASLVALAFAASACGGAQDSMESGDAPRKVVQPIEEVFEYAPEGQEIVVQKEVDDPLRPKGSAVLPTGPTYTLPVKLNPGQSVTFSTSGGSVGVDPVMALFMRHDNSETFGAAPWTQRVTLQTLAINDDTNGLHPSISYTNNQNRVVNARLMVFAYGSSTGQATLNNGTVIDVVAGSVVASGTAGVAKTTGSVGDPWLFTFDTVPNQGNGVWNDDTTSSNTESTITGATSQTMWYVGYGWGIGSTTVNY